MDSPIWRIFCPRSDGSRSPSRSNWSAHSMFFADEAHRDHRVIPLHFVGGRGGDGEGNAGAAVHGGGLGGKMVNQNAAHLFDVNVVDGGLQGSPGPAPCVARHVAEGFILPEAKTDLVSVCRALANRVVAANPPGNRWPAGTTAVAAGRAGKAETELDGAVVCLPGAERAELKTRVDHHGFGEPGFFDGRVTAR